MSKKEKIDVSNKFALEFAEKLLEGMLRWVREQKQVGSSTGVEIEALRRLKHDQYWMFEVLVWDELGKRKRVKRRMNYQRLKQLVLQIIPEDFMQVAELISNQPERL